MTDHESVSIRVDDRFDEYAPFFDEAWVAKMTRRAAGSRLAAAVLTLAVQWRAAAGACSMPWLACRSLAQRWAGRIASQEPFANRLASAIAERLAGEMGDALSHAKRRRLAEAVTRIGCDVHAEPAAADPFQPAVLWRAMLAEPEFQLAFWGSQRIAYGSIYHAYENFVRESIAVATGRPEYRGHQLKVLQADARRLVGPQVARQCLTADEVTIARLVRNALAHNAGRETKLLRGLAHGLEVEDGVLQILAADTRRLFDLLKVRAARFARTIIKLPNMRQVPGD